MANQSQAQQLATEAGVLRRQGHIAEARQRYEESLALELIPLNRAKILANIMQLHDQEGNPEQAEAMAWKAFDIIQEHDLASTMEGAHLRGYIRGYLMRLQGVPLEASQTMEKRFLLIFLSSFVIGAAIGAAVGSKIPLQGVTIAGIAFSDLRYAGAGIGAIVGWFSAPFLRVLKNGAALSMGAKNGDAAEHWGIVLLVVGGVVNFALLSFILTEMHRTFGLVFLAVLLSCFFFVHQGFKLYTPRAWAERLPKDSPQVEEKL